MTVATARITPEQRARKKPFADRLKEAQKRAEKHSVREFFLGLGEPTKNNTVVRWLDQEGGEQSVSYPAVKNYHSYEKPQLPPRSYLARVAYVYGLRLDWLEYGRGAPTEAEEVARQMSEPTGAELIAKEAMAGLYEGWREHGSPGLDHNWMGESEHAIGSPFVSDVMLRTWATFHSVASAREPDVQVSARKYAGAIASLLSQWGVELVDLDLKEQQQFVISACNTLLSIAGAVARRSQTTPTPEE